MDLNIYESAENERQVIGAVNEAKQFSLAWLNVQHVNKLVGNGVRVKDIDHLETLFIESASGDCLITSFNEAYYLWKNFSHLFRNIIMLHSSRYWDSITEYRFFSKSTEFHVGVITEDLDGIWRYWSTANMNYNPKYLNMVIPANDLSTLLSRIRIYETKFRDGVDLSKVNGIPRIYPTGKEITDILSVSGNLMPALDPTFDLNKYKPSPMYYMNDKVYPLNYSLMNVEALNNYAHRINHDVIKIPVIKRKSHTWMTYEHRTVLDSIRVLVKRK